MTTEKRESSAGVGLVHKATIQSAPAVLSTADKAMWATGWNECRDAVLKELASKAQETTPPPAQITVDFRQVAELLAMFGGEPAQITIKQGTTCGLYAWNTDHPDEEVVFLGSTDSDTDTGPVPYAERSSR